MTRPRLVTPDDVETLRERHRIRIFPAPDGPVRMRGTDARFEASTQHPPEGMMPLGAYSYSASLAPGIASVGRYCSIGRGLRVMGYGHPAAWASTSPVFYKPRRFRIMTGAAPGPMPDFAEDPAPAVIGNDVWVADDVTLSGGVRVGDGAVLAFGAVVTRDVPPYAVVGGVPARVIRMRWDAATCARAAALAWWRFDAPGLQRLPVEDPEAFLDAVEAGQDDLAALPERRMTLAEALAT
ncbi:CatB-related O-acetyltransferase [Jannaschia sp. W003]|uniref:CatB-related O-acetyltransferase n=1 Tax=Jannaschia sp. W003 TaxID=2867012 RepID=UPI00288354AF|nr:CatB-related O-acetyltransferase [Jannaschia sp. W003]